MTLFSRLSIALLLFIITLFSTHKAEAQQLATDRDYSGAELTARMNATQDSIIYHLEVYYDCPVSNANNDPVALFPSYSGAGPCSNVSLILLDLISDTEVSDVCPASLPFCGNGGDYKGTRMQVYEGARALSSQNCGVASYRIFGQDRREALNINQIATGTNWIRATMSLNLSNDSTNNTPTFGNVDPHPFFCKGVDVTFDLQVSDVDGDSLVFSSIGPRTGSSVNGTPYTYEGGYSVNNPFGTSFSIDATTGLMSFTAPDSGNYEVVVEVKEYDRTSGLLLSTTFRDFQIEVDSSCTNAGPIVASNFVSLTNVVNSQGNDTIILDTGVAASWGLPFTGDVGETVSLQTTAGSMLNGAATSTSTASNTTTLTVNWTPTGADIGTHIYTVSAEDNACVVSGKSAHKVVVIVQEEAAPFVVTSVVPTGMTCSNPPNGTITFNYTGGTGPFMFTVQGLILGQTDTNSTGIFTGLVNDFYTVYAIDSSTMSDTTISPISVAPNGLSITSITTQSAVTCDDACNGGVTVNHSGGNSPFTYTWSQGQTTKVVTDMCGADVAVTVTDNNGCSIDTVAYLLEPPVVFGTLDSSNVVTCNGGNDGEAYVSGHGGVAASTTTASYILDQTLGSHQPYPIGKPINISNPSYEVVSLGDDIYSPAKNIGFSFQFYGTNYTQFVIGSNGHIAMGNSLAGAFCVFNPPTMPSAVSPNNIIAAYWEDLLPSLGGTIEYYRAGSSPNRVLVVNFIDVVHYNNTLNPVTFQIVLHESSNIIEIFGTDCNTDGGGHVQGIEGNGTTQFNVVPGRNDQSFDLTNDYVAFIPLNQNFSYTWSSIGSGSSSTNLTAGNYTVTVANGSCTDTVQFNIAEPPAIVIDTALTLPLCNGDTNGQITASASGGNGGPYTYAWNTGATGATLNNIPAGTYTVTATDAAACTEELTIILTQPAVLTVSIAVDSAISCNGGSNGQLTATGLGGTPVYSYAWSPSGNTPTITGLNAGTYTVTVTDINGCTAEATEIMTAPSAVSVSIASFTDVSCPNGTDGSATANAASGGTPGYTYLWSSGSTNLTASNLMAGNYTITATDANGCTDTAQVTISEPANGVSITIPAGDALDCFGDSDGTLTANAATGGTGPYTYLWSGGGTTLTKSGLSAGTYTITATDANGCTDTASAAVTQPTLLTADTVSVTHPSCNGALDGSITATGVGGTGPYNYAWNGGGAAATKGGLAAGTHTVTVTDANGCTATLSTTLVAPAGISVTINVDSTVTCFGGSNGQLTANPTGGAAPFGYAWSPSGNTQTITGLTAGSYTVTVTDANGCTGTATQSVSQPASAVLASIASSTDVSCVGGNDGSATAQGAGGSPGYTFIWSNLDNTALTSGLTAGTYSVTVTDVNGCTDSASVVIDEPINGVTITIPNDDALDCFGDSDGSLTANAATGGTGPYTYLWSGGGTNLTKSGLTAGTYTITATDANGCTATASAAVTQPTLLTVDTTSTTQPTCATSGNGSITVAASGGTPVYAYAWSPSGTGATINGLNAGTYTVTATDANGCTATTTVVLSDQGGLNASITEDAGLTCAGDTTGQLTASSSTGVAPFGFAWNNGGSTATISNLGAGPYTVTITDANGCTDTAQATITAPNPIVFTAFTNISEISCDDACDGAATASASGGVAPLSFAWSSGSNTATATALCGGGHTVTITDANGCSITEILGLVEPPSLTAQLDSFNNVQCNGEANGEAYISAQGGWASSTSTAAYHVDQTLGEFEPYPKGQPWNATSYETITLPDDGNSDSIEIFSGGNFSFFGQSKTYMSVSSQGLVHFDMSQINTPQVNGMYSTTAAIPFNGGNLDPRDFIGAYWHDLDPSVNQESIIETYVLGTAPNRVRIVNYIMIDHFGAAPSIFSTFQIAMYEGSNIIQIHSDSLNSDGGNHVQGIENAAENLAYAVPGRNNTNFSATNDYVAFIPTSQNFTYTWSSVGSGASSTNLPAGSYTVTVSDGTCSDTVEFDITEPASFFVFSNKTDETCAGAEDGSINLTTVGGVAPFTFNWSNGDITQNVSGLAANTYSVTVTDANGCTATDTRIINAGVAVVLSMDSTDATCSGVADGSAEVTATGGSTPYTYIWSTGTTVDTIDNRPAGLYTVTVTDNNGCEAIDSVTINEGVGVVATATLDQPDCAGDANGVVTGGQIGGTGPFTYTWNIGAGQTQTGLTAGTYTLTVSDANGCEDDTTVTLINPPVLSVSIIDTLHPTCANNDGELEALATGGTGALSYSWLPSGNTAQITGLSAGTYTVIATDMNGCDDSATAILVAPPAVTINASMVSADTCANNTGVATVSVTTGTGPFGFSWNTGPTTQTISGLSAAIYTVTVTDINGCSAIDTTAIIDTCSCDLVATGVLVQNVNCNGGSDGIATVSLTGGVGPFSYAWSGGGGSNDTLSGVPAGTYVVTVTAQDGCTDTAAVTITQPLVALSASITSSTAPTCFGGSDGQAVVLAANGTPPYSYMWSSLSTNDTAMNLMAGLNTVTVTDANGCTAVASTTLGNGTSIGVTLAEESPASCFFGCDGEIEATVSGGTSPYIYDWSGTAPNDTTNSTSLILDNLCSGNYTVTITDGNGCTGTASTPLNDAFAPNVTITETDASCANSCDGQLVATYFCITCGPFRWFEGNDTSVFIGTGDTINGLCPGDYLGKLETGFGCLTLEAAVIDAPSALVSTMNSTSTGCGPVGSGTASVSVSGGTTPYSYIWNTFSTNDTITGLSAGTYTVTVTDGNGCQDTAEVIVNSTNGPVAQAFLITDADCFGAPTGSAFATQTGGTSPYTYGWSNGSTNDTITSLLAGSYTVTITDVNGCTDSATAVIDEPDSISFTFTETPISCGGPGDDGAISVSASGGTAGYSFIWSTATPGNSIANLTAGTYCVTATDAAGCTNSACYTLDPPGSFSAAVVDSADVLCFGDANGYAVVQVTSAGSGNYSYLWDNAATTDTVNNLTPGFHTVIVTDLVSGCEDTAGVTIDQPTPLVFVIDSVDSVTCLGGSDGVACGNISGGTPPYSLVWSNGATSNCNSGLLAGTYTVTVTDFNGCTVVEDTVVGEPALGLIASAVEQVPAACNGDSAMLIATATGGSGNYAFAWPGGFTTDTVMLPAGQYCVTVSDGGICTDTACVTVIDPPVVGASATLNQPSCPGGNDGSITATGTGGDGGPYTFLWDDNSTNPTRSPITQGTYSITVTDASGCTGTATFILTDPVGMSGTFSNVSASSCGSCNGSATVNISGGTPNYTYAWPGGSTSQTGTGLCAGLNTVTVTDNNSCVETFDVNIGNIGADTVFAATIQNASCNGGSDGIAEATYNCTQPTCSVEWFDVLTNTSQGTSDIVTGLAAGDYYVELTNGLGCLSFDTITITEPTPVVATITASTDVSCPNGNDGTATVSGSGGAGGYLFEWPSNNTNALETGLSSGTYCVTVTDANGCTDTACVIIDEPANGVSVTGVVISNVTCPGGNDGSVTATATQGVGPYTFLWNGTIVADTLTGLSGGQQIVQVTDANGCTSSDTFNVTEPTAISAVFSNITAPSCPGDIDGSATIAASGGTPGYTYAWPSGNTSTTENGLADGKYCVTITDAAGCTDTACVIISDPAGINNNFTALANSSCTVCDGEATANPSGGNGPVFTFAWDNGQTTASSDLLCGGINTVTITDAAGCTSVENVFINADGADTVFASGVDPTCGACDGEVIATYNCTQPTCTVEWFDLSTSTMIGTTDTVTGLCAGTYAVELTNGGSCVSVDTVSITAPPVIDPGATIADANCFGACDGSIILNPTGGSGTYVYAWSNITPSTPNNLNLCAGAYTVTISDGSGCDTVVTFNIDQPTEIITNPTVSNASCAGVCDGSINIGVSGGAGGYNFNWSPVPANGNGTSAATGLCAGTYFLTTTDVDGCSTLDTFEITQPSAIVQTSVTVTDATCNVCDGAITPTFTGGAGGYTFAWSHGPTSNNVTLLCFGLYQVTVTDASGCFEVFSYPVSETDGPDITLSSTNATANGSCDGTATVNVISSLGTVTYAWSNGDTSQTADSLCAGLVSVTVTDINGCSTVDTITITEPLVLLMSFDVTDITCSGNGCDGIIEASVTGGVLPYDFSWSNGDTTALIDSLCVGTYTLTLTDANGQQLIDSVELIVPQPFNIASSQTDVSCPGLCDGAITLNITGGAAPFTYAWDTGDTTSALTDLCGGNYSVTVTDTAGCSVAIGFTIDEPAPVIANIDNITNPDCQMNNGSVTVSGAGGNGGPYTFEWLDVNGDPLVPAQTSSTVSNLFAGIYNVRVIDVNGCEDTTVVILNNANAANIALDSLHHVSCFGACDGFIMTTISGGTAPYNILWSNGETTDDIDTLCAGNDTIAVVDANLCASFNIYTIEQPDLLEPRSIEIEDVICGADCNGSITIEMYGGTRPYSYTWSNGATDSALVDLCAGDYSLTVTDSNACTYMTTVTVGGPDPMVATLDSLDDATCINTGDGYIGISMTGGTAPYTYAWRYQNGEILTSQDISGVLAGGYGLTVTDANGCTMTDTFNVGADIYVDVTTMDDLDVCPLTNGVLITGTDTGANSVRWLNANGTIAGNGNSISVNTTKDSTMFVMEGINGVCVSRDTMFIYWTPGPGIDAGPDKSIEPGQSTTIGGAPTARSGISLTWTPATDITSTTAYNPEVNPLESRTYYVSATDEDECFGIDSVRITVEEIVDPVGGFSPNGDGVNDFFTIDRIEDYPNAIVQIFNRWGNVIYVSPAGYTTPWNGKYQGKELTVGTYYYVIDLKDPSINRLITGPVTILK